MGGRIQRLNGCLYLINLETRFSIDELLVNQIPGRCESLPGLKFRYESRLYLWISFEKVIESIYQCLTKLALSASHTIILRLRQSWDLQCAIQHVISKSSIAINLRCPSNRSDERILNLPEVIFGLSVYVSENAACIGRPIDVRDAIGITVDRN